MSVLSDETDTDYLISFDGEKEGQMYAGSIRVSMKKVFSSSALSSTGKKLILTLTGLQGGHSGLDINKNRLSGATILKILLSQAVNTNNARLISFTSGSAANAIANNLSLELAVSSSQSDLLKQAVDTVIDDLRNSYPDESFNVTLTQEEISSSLILIYPALCIPDNWNEKYKTAKEISDVTEFWGVRLSRRFFEEIRKIKVYPTITKFTNPVLIVHGSKDPVVPLSYSERAMKEYKDAHLGVIPGAGHGFRSEERKVSNAFVAEFLTE